MGLLGSCVSGDSVPPTVAEDSALLIVEDTCSVVELLSSLSSAVTIVCAPSKVHSNESANTTKSSVVANTPPRYNDGSNVDGKSKGKSSD